MRIRPVKKPLPRVWAKNPAAAGFILEADIGVGHGKLKAKLIVFKNRGCLRAFWRGLYNNCGGELGYRCLGAVSGLYCEVLSFKKGVEQKPYLKVDPRYFCVIGLIIGKLSMEVISHEAVHAAFAYVKRKSRSPWDVHAKRHDEEAVAYPAGRIAAAINRALHKAKLYDRRR
jgi:hypothetical protein